MYTLQSILVAGLLAASVTAADIRCAEGLKMFVSRGTGEVDPKGLGATGMLTQEIAKQIQGSDYEGILYPASVTEPQPMYFESVANGTLMLREAMAAYSRACPDSKMALFGYSQGAQITSNNLCGMPQVWGVFAGYNTSTEFDKLLELSTALPEDATKNVVAVVLFGDPTYTNNTSYNYGSWNNTGNGIFYRADTSQCSKLGSRIRSYCDAGDPYCDVGPFVDVTSHGTYLQRHAKDVAEFVVGQFRNGGKSDGGSGARSTPTPSANGSVPTSRPEDVGTSGASGLSPVIGLAMAATLLISAIL